MDQYFDYSAYQDQAEDSVEGNPHQPQHFAHAVNAPMQDQARNGLYQSTLPPPISCDVKPRLTKEQHDILEAHFQKQHKPTTNIKKNFAESLNVSLDKVNNWFQNRRAKSKQDAKKAAGQLSLYQTHSQTFGSDSEPSPYQPSHQFSTMMQNLSSEEHLPSGLGISQPQQGQVNDLTFGNDMSTADQFQNFSWSHGLTQDMFDSQLEFNRRTMTQEQFDAMSRDAGMTTGTGELDTFDSGFSGDHETMNQGYPGFDSKQDIAMYPYPLVVPPLSSNDSTVPSVSSEQSMPAFPSSHVMQGHPSISAASSDWTDSRSSSLASAQVGNMGAPMLPLQQPAQATSSQWEPGKSIPIDARAMDAEFRQISQAAALANQAQEQPQPYEQPLAWPSDEAYGRRGSTASMLAQSMGNVELQTPQPNDGHAVFKSPAPPTNIAARRQRAPKPANLGIASLRSQSFAGPGQPASPGHQQHNIPQGHSIRRVMSTNVLNGGVAQGRIMKSVPGSAQRSPLNWNFNDALNSPHFNRTVSQTNLAPPTPMSPSHPGQAQQAPNFQNGANQATRHASMNESEEHGIAGLPYQPSNSRPPHVSPPHTPMYYQQGFLPQRIGSNVITENTPPQSAPASQSCFPSNIFGMPPPQHPQMAAIANAQHQQYLNLAVPDAQFQMPNVTFAPNQHTTIVSSGPAPGVPLTFATGVPVMNADGNYQMSFPAQMQMMQPHQGSSPPQVPYAFVNSNGGSPNTIHGQLPKLPTQPANDFVVHEYSPPDAIKRSVTPRKTVDSGPKNYTFANAGPVDYEEKAKKAEGKDSSSSPSSSTGSVLTS